METWEKGERGKQSRRPSLGGVGGGVEFYSFSFTYQAYIRVFYQIVVCMLLNRI